MEFLEFLEFLGIFGTFGTFGIFGLFGIFGILGIFGIFGIFGNPTHRLKGMKPSCRLIVLWETNESDPAFKTLKPETWQTKTTTTKPCQNLHREAWRDRSVLMPTQCHGSALVDCHEMAWLLRGCVPPSRS